MPKRPSYISRMGGKFSSAPYICSLFPPSFDMYIEPFLGGGHVFLTLPKSSSTIYVLNDLHKDIYDLWHDLQTTNKQDILHFDFSNQSSNLFKDLKNQTTLTDPKDRLYRNLYLSLFSFSGNRLVFTPKRKTRGNHLFKHLDFLKDKLENVKIYNMDYKDVVNEWDNPNSMFFLDPPYVGLEKYYEGQSIDPYELAGVCRLMKGKFILTYNDCHQVRDAFHGFNIIETPMIYTSGVKTKRCNELFITNY